MTNPKRYIYVHGSVTEWCVEDFKLWYRTSYDGNESWSKWHEQKRKDFYKLGEDLKQNLKLCLDNFEQLLLDKELNDYDEENNYKDYMAISHTKCDSDQLRICDDE